jgi:formylglycine-generating enzyme required for sulfatase activity
MRSALSFLQAAGLVVVCVSACSRRADVIDAGALMTGAAPPAPSASAAPPRPGMVWIPKGILKAGSRPYVAPRVAEEELPWVDVELEGFYVDVLPYPNESGAIPTSNVTRDEAEKLCEAKGKRLCTELEWERACKGPKNTDYEYGDTYRAATCGTGVDIELAARRPTGERSACKSDFGVLEMHGGAWEWTASSWGRSSKEPDLAVLRGGNSEKAGEIVGRCANAIARRPTTKASTMGFRCCAGPRNEARVELSMATGPALERLAQPEKVGAKLVASVSRAPDAGPSLKWEKGWTWRPVQNEELGIAVVCSAKPPPHHCLVFVGRESGPADPIARFDAGSIAPDLAQLADPKTLRARGFDATGSYSRELTYAYGRVEIGDAKRP